MTELSTFEQELLAKIQRLKAELAARGEGLSGFTLRIEAVGRLDGDVAVSFTWRLLQRAERRGRQPLRRNAGVPAAEELERA